MRRARADRSPRRVRDADRARRPVGAADGDVVLPVTIIRSAAAGTGSRPDRAHHRRAGAGGPRLTRPSSSRPTSAATATSSSWTSGAPATPTRASTAPRREPVTDAERRRPTTPSPSRTASFEAAWSSAGPGSLGDGVDLAQYDTPATAADFADLREAMPIDEWNVWGHSYGTVVAQELVRSHPRGSGRSSSTACCPLDVAQRQGRRDRPRRATRFDRLFDGCAADPACAAAYPTLEARTSGRWSRSGTRSRSPSSATGPDGAEHDVPDHRSRRRGGRLPGALRLRASSLRSRR